MYPDKAKYIIHMYWICEDTESLRWSYWFDSCQNWERCQVASWHLLDGRNFLSNPETKPDGQKKKKSCWHIPFLLLCIAINVGRYPHMLITQNLSN